MMVSFAVGNRLCGWLEATTPAPTVRPPSRIAKRSPSSIAIGVHHLGALRQMHRSRHRRRAEVKLRPVIPKKRRVSPALLLGQDIGLALKAGIGLGFDRADAL